MTYLGMQIMVEGWPWPRSLHAPDDHRAAAQQLLRYVMSDEARHVAFGVLSLKEYYAELTDAEMLERQEFAFGPPCACGTGSSSRRSGSGWA